MLRKANALPMGAEQRRQWEAWARGKSISARLVELAKTLLLLGDGFGIRPTAEELGVAFKTVRGWRDRF